MQKKLVAALLSSMVVAAAWVGTPSTAMANDPGGEQISLTESPEASIAGAQTGEKTQIPLQVVGFSTGAMIRVGESFDFEGFGHPGKSVEIFLQQENQARISMGSVLVGADQRWKYHIAPTDLPTGDFTVSAEDGVTAFGDSYDRWNQRFIRVVPSNAFASAYPFSGARYTQGTKTTLTGWGKPGQQIRLEQLSNGNPWPTKDIGTTIVAFDGTWTLDVDVPAIPDQGRPLTWVLHMYVDGVQYVEDEPFFFFIERSISIRPEIATLSAPPAGEEAKVILPEQAGAEYYYYRESIGGDDYFIVVPNIPDENLNVYRFAHGTLIQQYLKVPSIVPIVKPVIVTPLPPSLDSAGKLVVPKMTGVEYSVVESDIGFQVTAKVTDGYVLASGATTAWALTKPKDPISEPELEEDPDLKKPVVATDETGDSNVGGKTGTDALATTGSNAPAFAIVGGVSVLAAGAALVLARRRSQRLRDSFRAE